MNQTFVFLFKKNKNYGFLAKDGISLTRNADEGLMAIVENYDQFDHYLDMRLYQKLVDKYNIEMTDEFYLLHKIKIEEAQKELDSYYPQKRKSISKKQREIVYNMFGGHCAYCGQKLEYKDLQVDHILSHIGNCGTDTVGNYYPSCRDCNQFKRCHTIDGFKKAIKDTPRLCSKRNKDYLWDRIYRKYELDKDKNKEIVFYFEKK